MNPDDRFFRYVRSFLLIYLPKNRCCSQNTVKSYRETIHLLRTFFKQEKGLAFNKITFDHFNHVAIGEFLDWLENERGNSTATRNQRLAALKSFCKYAAQEDASLMLAYLELGKVPLKRANKPAISYLSEAALSVLLQQPDRANKRGIRDQFMMVFLYDTGARIQEVLDLRIADLHLGERIPFVHLTGKGQKTRAVPLMDRTIEHLKAYMEYYHRSIPPDRDDLLFYTIIKNNVGKMSPDTVASFLNRYGVSARPTCAEVPIRVHAHLFRHTRAMHLYQAGIPLSYIKDFLGHASVNTTDIYAAADVTMLREALERTYTSDRATLEAPRWKDDEELLIHLCGLK